ncbi:MAG: hypothetical protein K2X35_23795 [Bryobacteraceae bacterium]|nr:hypothetical protein [Bryobacteraceae bacterium]
MSGSSPPIFVREARLEDGPALERLNRRLEQGSATARVPAAAPTLRALTGPTGLHYRRMLVAVQEDEIRAAAQLVHHRFWVGGEARPFAWIQLPVSEGMVNRAYAMAIVQILRTALKQTPWMLSLGVGSIEEPWARMATSLGWKRRSIPFFFHPVRVPRVLKELRALRRKPWLGTACRLLAASGAGHAGSLVQAIRYGVAAGRRTTKTTLVHRFPAETDDIFSASLAAYPAVAERTAESLNSIYPAGDLRFRRLIVTGRESGTTLGWAVCCLSRMQDNHHFGDLCVGVLADGFGPPGAARAVMTAAADHLIEAGADVLVANWSHPDWIAAARALGFVSAPSNYLLFASPAASSPLLGADRGAPPLHLTRGDSDGVVSFRRVAVVATP